MGKRKPWTLQQWRSEGDFIAATADKVRPGAAFGNSWATFREYCRMQERFAREDGAEGIANRIANARIKCEDK